MANDLSDINSSRFERDRMWADRVGGVREGNVAVNAYLWPDLGVTFFVPLMPQDMVIRREDAEALLRCLTKALAK